MQLHLTFLAVGIELVAVAHLHGAHSKPPQALGGLLQLRALASAVEGPRARAGVIRLVPQNEAEALLQWSQLNGFQPRARRRLVAECGVRLRLRRLRLSIAIRGLLRGRATHHAEVRRRDHRVPRRPLRGVRELLPQCLAAAGDARLELVLHDELDLGAAVPLRHQEVQDVDTHDDEHDHAPPEEEELKYHGIGLQELALLPGAVAIGA
mmetsp:Transcript_18515/g.37268  ORF Transcript_18515/g.37268 Transcript_18515/m.37268 type:complete len:209 (+) Transcript_18515:235-861(+)